MSDLDLTKYAPASDELLASFRKSIVEMREHVHPREDFFCINLASYMGERMGVVLRRLADAEAEVEGLRARVEDEEEMVRGVRESLAWVEREYRQCTVAARSTTDSTYYAQVNGRAEAYRQLADRVAAAAGLTPPDWDRIRSEVPGG